jgi:VWFA-related protein
VPGNAAELPAASSSDRYIALYFDDLNTSDADLIQARDAADHFLTTNLRPKDHVAIFTAGKALSSFVSDPRQVHEALLQLRASRKVNKILQCPDLSDYQAEEMIQDGNPLSSVWTVALAEAKTCAPPPDPRSNASAIRMLAEQITAQAQGRVRENLQMFAQVVRYIAQAPGQRIVVLVSPGFLSRSDQLSIDRTIDLALRAQVVINSLDPKGLAVLMRESDASKATSVLPDPRATEARHHVDAESEFVGTDVLAEFAQGTGGEFFHNDNDLKAGFNALAGRPDEYVLAFASQAIKPDGKYHELRVTLTEKQKGSTILARRGYYAVKEETATVPAVSQTQAKNDNATTARETQAASGDAGSSASSTKPSPAGAEDQDQVHIQDALRSKAESMDLPVGIEASPSEGEGAKRLLAMTVHLDTRALPLRSDSAHHLDALTFAVAVYDANDSVVEVRQRHATVDLSDDELQDFLSDGVDVNMMFDLKPATYRLRVAVIESNQHKLAEFSRIVSVP